MQLISLSQKGHFILYDENKIAFYFKKGCFIVPQNQRFRLKKGSFSCPESAKRGCFPNLGTSVVYVLVGSGGAGPSKKKNVARPPTLWVTDMTSDTLINSRKPYDACMWRRTNRLHSFDILKNWVNTEHYGDVIMSAIASQITGFSILCSIGFFFRRRS